MGIKSICQLTKLREGLVYLDKVNVCQCGDLRSTLACARFLFFHIIMGTILGSLWAHPYVNVTLALRAVRTPVSNMYACMYIA